MPIDSGSRGAAAWRALCLSHFVVELSPDGIVLDVNGKLADALGHERAAMIGRPHRAFIARREGAADADPAAPHRVIAYAVRAGGELLVQATTTPILDAEGIPVRALVIGVDVTDRSVLRGALARAENTARARADLLAVTSRGMRTPMAGLMGFAELLLGGDLSPQQRRQAEAILDSGRHMLALLGGVLDVEQIDRGAASSVPEPVEIGRQLEECAELMRPMAGRKGVALRCETAPELPPLVAGDSARLRQVVLNLLDTAIDCAAVGTVALAAERAWDDPQVLSISVTGPGPLPPGGEGLGAVIAHELARLMGGMLSFSGGGGGGGMRAELRLPLAPCDADAAPSVPVPITVARERRRDRPRVLVAEDHDINRALVLDQLERLGARPCAATNGALALAMVAEAEAAGDPYRLVYMDIRMPVMDGLEAARRLRENGHTAAQLPIVALTANAYPEDREACLAAGMQEDLAKPAGLAALARALDRWAPERRRYVRNRSAHARPPAAPAAGRAV